MFLLLLYRKLCMAKQIDIKNIAKLCKKVKKMLAICKKVIYKPYPWPAR